MARHDWRTIPLAVLAGILLAACSPGDEDVLAAESGSDEAAIPQVADDPADAGNSTAEPPSTPADVTPSPPVDSQPPVDQPEDPPVPEAPSTSPDQPTDAPGNPQTPSPDPQPPEDQPEIPNVPETPSTDPEPPVEAVPDPEPPVEATPDPELPVEPAPDPEPPTEATPEPETPAEEPEPRVNNPPSISGSATASTMVGVAYSFTPIAADPDGDALSWSITGKPAGATFSPATGKLDWTPQSAGVWNNIVVTVTDGEGASASLPPFSITVEQPVVSGTAALRWEAPIKYSDGSALPANVLAGYRIYHGTSESSLARIAEVDSLTTSLTFEDLEKGTHYFAVMAFSDSGDEGERSAILSKSIP